LTREQESTTRRPARRSRIPTFKSVEEAAQFWDSHDSAEFEDEFEDVENVGFVKSRRTKAMTVRLEDDTMAALTKEAHDKGVGPSTLARMWIRERLKGADVSRSSGGRANR
jgi:hypothetical protein